MFILSRLSMTPGLNKSGAKCTMANISWICPGTSHSVIMTFYVFTKVLFVYSQQANDDALSEQKWHQVYNGEQIVDLPWYISRGYHACSCFTKVLFCLFLSGDR